MFIIISIIFICTTLFLPSLAHAWSDQGHQLIADIAEANLTPSAKVKIAKLLPLATPQRGQTPKTLADIATYADWIKYHGLMDTSRWHFVDIPDEATVYNPQLECVQVPEKGDCLINALGREEAILKDNKASLALQAQALMFLVHLVGDLHQPLHCDEQNQDMGGNTKRVSMDYSDSQNLHALWDRGIITRYYHDKGWDPSDNQPYLNELKRDIGRIKPIDRQKLFEGSWIDWALESHALAHADAYGLLPQPTPDGEYVLKDSYFQSNLPIVNQQLERAGLRLAFILNSL